MIGAVYLIKLVESADDTVYKIGRTKRSDGSRVASYGKDSVLLRLIECSNPDEVEAKLIQLFNTKFSLFQGKEYFKGKEEAIVVQCFDVCVSDSVKLEIAPTVDIEDILGQIRAATDQCQIQTMSNLIYDHIGVIDTYRQRLKELSQLQGFAINANIELKLFGVVANKQWSDKIRRCLLRQDLVDITPPTYEKDFFGVIEESPYCRAIRTKSKKDIQSYTSIEYWITWTGLYKVLTRSVGGPDYATYFAIQSQISMMNL